jgi:hypothetical protein
MSQSSELDRKVTLIDWVRDLGTLDHDGLCCYFIGLFLSLFFSVVTFVMSISSLPTEKYFEKQKVYNISFTCPSYLPVGYIKSRTPQGGVGEHKGGTHA